VAGVGHCATRRSSTHRGIGSISDVGRRTLDFLAPDDERASPADAVLYLTPHLHSGDVRFLEAFHDDAHSAATPVNAIGVLSRADEIGGARLDAIGSARAIAERYRHQRDLRRLCQTFVPVAGLLAQAAATLTEAEYRALARLAALGDDDRAALLISADRFASPLVPAAGVGDDERAALVTRFGPVRRSIRDRRGWPIKVSAARERSPLRCADRADG